MNKKTLKKLMELPGIPGQENLIVNELIKKFKSNNFKIKRDNLGSIWGIKNTSENAPTVLIDAHIDEVGFEVTQITKDGKLKFENLGGISVKDIYHSRLKVWNSNKDHFFIGIVLGRKDFVEHRRYVIPKTIPLKMDELLLDIGASSKEEVEEKGIEIGSMITFEGDVEYQFNSVIGKAADNRVGVALIHELSNFISKENFNYNIVIGGSVQEEVGLRGARTSANKFKPDLAIVIDVSPAFDGYGEQQSGGILGKGTLLRHKDAYTVFPKTVTSYIKNIANKHKIPIQDYFGVGGTNAGIIHISNQGTITIPVGLSARNLHTSSQVFNIEDYNNTLDLLKAILKNLSALKIINFKQF